MRAEIQPLAGVLRVFADEAAYPDPYIWCATVQYIDRDTVEIMGITQAPTPSIWRAIKQHCKAIGIKKITYTRQPSGRVKVIELAVDTTDGEA